MNNGIKYFILFLLIDVSTGELFCQRETESGRSFIRGFIITNTGDTVDGFIGSINKNALLSACIFKPGIADKATTLGPSSISGFGSYVDNLLYTSVPILTENGEKSLFVRIIFDGTYDLLYYEFLGFKHFLVRRPLATIFDIIYPPVLTKSDSLKGITRDEKFTEAISSIFFSSPEMQEYAKNVRPEAVSLGNYFKKYHELSGEPFTVYKGKQKSLSAGLVIGATFDRYLINIAEQKIQSFSKPAPYAGIYARMVNIKTGSGFFLQSSVSFKSHHYSYFVETPSAKNYYETFITSLASVSRLGITVNSPKVKTIMPFIEGGALTCVYLNPKYENYRDQLLTDANSVFTYHNNDILNSIFYYGAFLRVGSILNLKNRNSLKFSGSYDFLLSSGTQRIHSIDLSVTYIMKFK